MSETALKIRIFGDPALRKKSRPVTRVSENHRDILNWMARVMYAGNGIGLAAPQIGINESMIVVDIGSGLSKLINPKIAKKEGLQVLSEGCLSIPGVYVEVRRAKRIRVDALDENGKPIQIEAQDLLACVMQHEIDHLKGRLIVDYASFFEKLKIGRKLGVLKKKAKSENLAVPEKDSGQLQL